MYHKLLYIKILSVADNVIVSNCGYIDTVVIKNRKLNNDLCA
ncbi:MAG: hypothetical protein ACK5HP_01760 [Bacilli bacterium]